jgi:hypothetical protein
MQKAQAMWLWIGSALLIAAACSSDESESNGSAGASGKAGSAGRGGASGASGSAGASGTSGSSSGGSAGASGASASGGSSGANGSSGSGGASADAASDGRSGAGGQPQDPCASARFCEDFESYTTGMAPSGSWRARVNRGAVSVVEEQKFLGLKSAKFTTEMNSSGKTAYIELASTNVFPVPGNMFYGRMMFRLESAPSTAVHWTFIQAGGVIPGQSYHSIYRYGGQHPVNQNMTFVGNQLMANYDTPDSYSGTGPSSDCWLHANGTVVPVARWACAEWQFDGPNNTLRFWLDGKALDDLTVVGRGEGCVHQSATFPWTAPNFDRLSLGWESYQGDSARTLYIDNVVLDTKPIGCPPP